jgi:O-antigen/teichoic acid export membrane protein
MTTKTNWGRRLLANAAMNFIGQAILLLLTFFATPYLIRHFGSVRYGVLILLLSFVNLLNLFQLGLNTGLVKYLAEDFGQSDHEDSGRLLNTGLTLYLLVGTLPTIVLAMLARWSAARFFHVPSDLQHDIVLSFYVVSFAFLVRFVAEVFNAVPIAAQRFDLVNALFVGSECARILGSVLVVYLGFLLKAVVVVNLLANVLFLVGSAAVAKYLIPGLNLRLRCSRDQMSRLWHFTKFAGIETIFSRVGGNADGLIIGHLMPVAYVAFYSVPFALCYKIWAFVFNVTTAVFPAVSAMASSGEVEKLKDLYLRGSKMVMALAALPSLALFLFSKEVLRYWISPEFALQGSLTLRFLSAAFFVNCFAHMPDVICAGVGSPRIGAEYCVVESILRIGSLFVLVPHFGIVGAASGYLIIQIILAPWILIRTNALVGAHWRDLLIRSYAPIVVPAGITGLFIALARPYINSLPGLIFVLSLVAIIYAAMAAIFILDKKERSACLSLLSQRLPIHAASHEVQP